MSGLLLQTTLLPSLVHHYFYLGRERDKDKQHRNSSKTEIPSILPYYNSLLFSLSFPSVPHNSLSEGKMMFLRPCCILTACIFFFCLLQPIFPSLPNLTIPGQHPDPEEVVQHFHSKLNASLSRRELSSISQEAQTSSCLTGNPTDDCWRCGSDWRNDRQRLADCSIGFGRSALGGKGGKFYVVTDSSDMDPANPKPGTLRFAVIQDAPLWITFSADMTIQLRHELIMNSYKTIDGRGANVHVTGNGCITIQYISNIIIHNVHVHHCNPSGNANIRSTPTHVGWRGRSDGDGISIFSASNIWIDHCSLSYCTDGLIDAIMASTRITVSNSYFSHHDEVMLLGHDDKYTPDSAMQVTIAFNRFGEALVQRMPRCRHGYIHVVNNDFTSWEMYAIGGSANPTINSQGNRYTAPVNPDAKEVTKRVSMDENEWADWNWRTDGDVMVNGAFFVPSGAGLSAQYLKASSVDPKSAAVIDQLTTNAGVLGGPRDSGGGDSYPGFSGGSSAGTAYSGSNGSSVGEGEGYYFGMIFGSDARPAAVVSTTSIILLSSPLILVLLCTLPPTKLLDYHYNQ